MRGKLNVKVTAFLLFAVAVGFALGAVLVSWAYSVPAGELRKVFQEKMEETSLRLSHVEAETKALHARVSLAGTDGSARRESDPAGSQSERGAQDQGDTGTAVADQGIQGKDPLPPEAAIAPDQEREHVAAILENMQDHVTYPDLPSLMASSEVRSLSPEARMQVMDEVVRRLNSGELDMKSFLPKSKTKNQEAPRQEPQ